ncbi:MAG TPA: sterol desaturase family protein [Alphaproteobacteria bacterium]|nr:sterol desaturase family protein [Alphaproteobacteria bacterium]
MTDILAIFQDFISTEIRFHPVYLLPFFIIAFVVYLRRKPFDTKATNFWSWLFPKDVYFHPSHLVDLKLFFFSRLLFITKFLNVFFVQVAFAVIGMKFIGIFVGTDPLTHELTFGRVLMATLIVTIVSDFCVYWVHRLHHESPVIWPFHAVHHSAEVMTPVTVYRKHPVYDVISDFTKSVFVGLAQGMILMLLIGKVQLTLLAGINVFYFFFNFLGSNFRHSHIWISYGRTLEHIFISPAQHQVHHSLEPKHHNKNYGELLAIWDWIFGTLYIPEKYEELSYGISKSSTSHERIIQPHPTLKAALIVPFQDSWKAYKRAKSRKRT